jgi:Na+-driven multidrug efflux pump
MIETAVKASIIGLSIMTVAIIMIWLFARPLMSIFSRDATLIQIGTTYLRVATVGLWSYIFLNISVSMLQAIKKPIISFLIGMYRQLFPVVVFAYLGGTLGYGVSGIWWGIVLVNWSAVLLAIPITLYLFKKATQSFEKGPA